MWEQLDPEIPWVIARDSGGSVQLYCQACGAGGGAVTDQQIDAFVDAHETHQSASTTHIGAGEAFAQLTARLKMRHCTPCERRQHQLNRMVPRMPFMRR